MSLLTTLRGERLEIDEENEETLGRVSYRDGAGDLREFDFHEEHLRDWAVATPDITIALYGILKCSHAAPPPCAGCRAAGWAALEKAKVVP